MDTLQYTHDSTTYMNINSQTNILHRVSARLSVGSVSPFDFVIEHEVRSVSQLKERIIHVHKTAGVMCKRAQKYQKGILSQFFLHVK